jgi:ribosomal protein S18 acetylase RimI-like enzyme
MADLSKHAELIVAEDEGQILGAVAYCPPGSTPRADFFDPQWSIVRMLVVAPSGRGRGIGRRLTNECIYRSRRDEASAISLHTSPVMEVALNMYLRMGFNRRRRVPDRFGVPYGVYTLQL